MTSIPLSEMKKEVIKKVIFEEKTPTELSADMRKDRTTISRHLNELKESGLVKFDTHGRESVYVATLPVQILYENEHMIKGEAEVDAQS